MLRQHDAHEQEGDAQDRLSPLHRGEMSEMFSTRTTMKKPAVKYPNRISIGIPVMRRRRLLGAAVRARPAAGSCRQDSL